MDYNDLFAKLQEDCDRELSCNAFAHITLEELINLNFLLDRFMLFCESIDDLGDFECGDKVQKLYDLVDTLFTRDYFASRDVGTDEFR